MTPENERILIEELRRLTAAIEKLANATGGKPSTPATAFRNVYTPAEFSAEILCGNLSVEWVQDQCRMKRIKTVTRRPFTIPQIEAMRFVSPPPGK